MKHHQYNPTYKFVKEPVDFNKYTDRSLLQYCLGATMYMPGTKDFAQAIIDKKYQGDSHHREGASSGNSPYGWIDWWR